MRKRKSHNVTVDVTYAPISMVAMRCNLHQNRFRFGFHGSQVTKCFNLIKVSHSHLICIELHGRVRPCDLYIDRHSRDPYKYVVIFFSLGEWTIGRGAHQFMASTWQQQQQKIYIEYRKTETNGIVKANVSSTLPLSKVRTKSERRTIYFFSFTLFLPFFALPALRLRISTHVAHTLAFILSKMAGRAKWARNAITAAKIICNIIIMIADEQREHFQ